MPITALYAQSSGSIVTWPWTALLNVARMQHSLHGKGLVGGLQVHAHIKPSPGTAKHERQEADKRILRKKSVLLYVCGIAIHQMAAEATRDNRI